MAWWRVGAGGSAAVPARAAAAAIAAWRRGFASTAIEAQTTLLREFQAGRQVPLYLPFEMSVEQGVQKYLAWQRRNKLTPGDLLQPGSHEVRAVLLPFWLFSAHVHVRYTGTVGSAASSNAGGTHWRDVGWHDLPPQTRSMQARSHVYASYKYRRDFGRAVGAAQDALARLQPLSLEAVQAGMTAPGTSATTPTLHLPAMRQAIAWELMVQALREQEVVAARRRLEEEHGTSQVRDVRAGLRFSHRQARLAFLPAFHLAYRHGETFNAHGERVPQEFEALVSGLDGGGVAGPRHYSATRAAGATGSALALGALGASAVAAPLVGMDPWSLVNMETGFAFFLAVSGAGLGVRAFPVLLQQALESSRIRKEDAETEQIMAMGLGPLDAGTEEQESLRSSAEWRRWEESGKEAWEEGKRERWAEALFQGQHRRRTERARIQRRLVEEQARQAAEEAREERRRRRWGHSSHFHAHARHHAHGESFAGGRRGGGRLDYLGYYRLLGLEVSQHGSPSGEEIKRAFRRKALQLHPDRLGQDAPEAERRAGRDKFSELARAYQVLRDPERRRQYDRGEVGQM